MKRQSVIISTAVSVAITFFIGFLFKDSLISKADCMNMIDSSIQTHEEREEKLFDDIRREQTEQSKKLDYLIQLHLHK